MNKYQEFRFEKFSFDYVSGELELNYSYDGESKYQEVYRFELPKKVDNIDRGVVEALSFYLFIVAGASYYKSFLAPKLVIEQGGLDYWQCDFFNMIYRMDRELQANVL